MLATKTVLQALKDRIAAVVIPNTTIAAFEKVEFYTDQALQRALSELFIYKQSVCLIIPDGEDWEGQRAGSNLHAARSLEVMCIISDRDYGKRVDAAFGDSERQGCIALKDLVLDALIGEDLGLPGVWVVPASGELFVVDQKARAEMAGRESWAQGFRIELPTERRAPGPLNLGRSRGR